MSEKQKQPEQKQGISKVKLALGAASLFLFIVGLKKTFQIEEVQGGGAPTGKPGGTGPGAPRGR